MILVSVDSYILGIAFDLVTGWRYEEKRQGLKDRVATGINCFRNPTSCNAFFPKSEKSEIFISKTKVTHVHTYLKIKYQHDLILLYILSSLLFNII